MPCFPAAKFLTMQALKLLKLWQLLPVVYWQLPLDIGHKWDMLAFVLTIVTVLGLITYCVIGFADAAVAMFVAVVVGLLWPWS